MENSEYHEEEEILEPSARNIITSLIGQLSKGSDLHRVTLPTFVLEPRSFLERITDFMSHPEELLEAHKLDSPEKRMLAICHYFLSGWHIRPKGVRKPYNPVLGEYFRCRWNFSNGTKGYYLSEQVSHHPPISAYVFASPDNNFIIEGEMRPKSKFYGTSAGTMLEGSARIRLLNFPGEEYTITYPNIYVYGILFGKLTYELGDVSVIRCEKTNLVCKAEFKTKGLFSGSYHDLAGKIKKINTGETVYEIQGKWTDKLKLSDKGGKSRLFFDAISAEVYPKDVAPEAEQDEFESRRLWQHVTENLKVDLDKATEEKSRIEQNQRDRTRKYEEAKKKWKHRFFNVTESGSSWKLENLPLNPVEANEAIENFIFNYNPNSEEC
ncbi:Oxysterol-binding protein [Neoconidiobolus thromboides FSU 785]|nr:Oxysterol-binding protein [Neoconidiobolus thromboides FSU 785]